MPLAPGSRLGPYEITAAIGAGGMGEVFRARDPRLGRDVAIKVLPEVFAADRERMARFEREAKVLASLNHPNIAAIYGFEEAGATRALVLELVEGATLADRIEQGAIPAEDAVAIARQIAEALEYAHDRGVVHRDLKPANVKLRPDGTVKVLDFGLARALEDDPSGSRIDLGQSPTITAHMTMAGVILGTAAYMAPEQAKGRAADRRADIWAFGVVLFEMLTGRQTFEGETASETLAAVMKDEIPWSRLPAATPPRMRRLLERCLMRDPRQRLQAIGEARIVLEGGGEAEPAAAAVEPVSARRVASPVPLVGVAIAAAVLAFAGAWALRGGQAPAPPLRKYAIALHPRISVDVTSATISPDGSSIAFHTADTLWVRSLVTLEIRAIAPSARGTAFAPFWSPSGDEIGFTDGARLLRASIAGGTITPVCKLPVSVGGGSGGSWAESGSIYLAFGNRGLFEVKASGGEAQEIAPPDSASSDYHEPFALPGGRGVVFVRHKRVGGPRSLAVYDGRSTRELYEDSEADVWRPTWSPSGHLLFHRTTGNPGLWALPFSLDRLQVTGDPFLLTSEGAMHSVTRSGTLLYLRTEFGLGTAAAWVGRDGTVLDTLPGELPGGVNPAISPEGRRIAISVLRDGNRDIWLLDLERGTSGRLTFHPGEEDEPAWAHDGSEIYYSQDSDSAAGGVFAVSASGGGVARRVSPGFLPAVSRDATLLTYSAATQATVQDLFVVRLGADTTGTAVVSTPGADGRGEFSPNADFLLYVSDVSGAHEAYLTRCPSGVGRWQVSNGGGRRSRWGPGGDRIYYTNQEGTVLYEVDVQLGSAPVFGTPRPVLDLAAARLKYWGGRTWDVHPDGERFLALLAGRSSTDASSAVVVENWIQEFAQRK
jgi:Tol biopolymer transport system component